MKQRVKGRLERIYEQDGEYCLAVSIECGKNQVILSISEEEYQRWKEKYNPEKEEITVYLERTRTSHLSRNLQNICLN